MVLILLTLVIVGFNMWRGHREGLLHIILSLCSTLLAIIVAGMLAGPINTYIEENTGIYDQIIKQTDKFIGKTDAIEDQKALETSVTGDENTFRNSAKEIMNKVGVPEDIQESLLGVDVAQLAKDGIYTAKDLVVRAVSRSVGLAIVFVLLFLVMKIALSILIRITDLLNRLPLIGDINQFAGMIVGAAYGIVLVWVVLVFINMFSNMEIAQFILSGIEGNPLAELIYNNNIVMKLIAK